MESSDIKINSFESERLAHQSWHEGVAICQYIKDFVFTYKDIAQPTSGSCSQNLCSQGQLPLQYEGIKKREMNF